MIFSCMISDSVCVDEMLLQWWALPKPQRTTTCEADLWNRRQKEENCLSLMLPSCQNTLCSFSCSDSHTPISSMSISSSPPRCVRVGGKRCVWSARREIYLYSAWGGAENAAWVLSVCRGGRHLSVWRSFLSTKSVTSLLAAAETPTTPQRETAHM